MQNTNKTHMHCIFMNIMNCYRIFDLCLVEFLLYSVSLSYFTWKKLHFLFDFFSFFLCLSRFLLLDLIQTRKQHKKIAHFGTFFCKHLPPTFVKENSFFFVDKNKVYPRRFAEKKRTWHLENVFFFWKKIWLKILRNFSSSSISFVMKLMLYLFFSLFFFHRKSAIDLPGLNVYFFCTSIKIVNERKIKILFGLEKKEKHFISD